MNPRLDGAVCSFGTLVLWPQGLREQSFGTLAGPSGDRTLVPLSGPWASVSRPLGAWRSADEAPAMARATIVCRYFRSKLFSLASLPHHILWICCCCPISKLHYSAFFFDVPVHNKYHQNPIAEISSKPHPSPPPIHWFGNSQP